MLMDRELPDDERSRIGATIRAHPEVRGIHDLRTRASGPQIFIQCHIELESTLTQIGRASCRERVCPDVSLPVGAVTFKKNTKKRSRQPVVKTKSTRIEM